MKTVHAALTNLLPAHQDRNPTPAWPNAVLIHTGSELSENNKPKQTMNIEQEMKEIQAAIAAKLGRPPEIVSCDLKADGELRWSVNISDKWTFAHDEDTLPLADKAIKSHMETREVRIATLKAELATLVKEDAKKQLQEDAQ
jgi:hypothetical protein